ncbi:MAG: hypothetical protein ACTSRG_12595 [Candidatus Helarchaeota archaeon]
MKSIDSFKRLVITFLIIISPFLTLSTFYSSNIPYSDLFFPKKTPLKTPPNSNLPLLQILSTDFFNGKGNDLYYEGAANVTGAASKLNGLPLLVTTNAWNITHTSFNITNIKAYTINKFEESSNNTQENVDNNNQLFARSFTIGNSCVINNFSIYRSALANDVLNLTTGGTASVDYGPINITVMIWNATWAGLYYEPDEVLKKLNYNNRKYGWAMNGSTSHVEHPEIGWELFDTNDFYLNTENTGGKTFFISINTTKNSSTYDSKEISSHYKWYLQSASYLSPNTFNSTDGGKNWTFPNYPVPIYSMTLGVNISLATDTFYPSNISLKIDNIPVNDTINTNQGLWTRTNFYSYSGSNVKNYAVTSNWTDPKVPSPISLDVSFNLTMNKSGYVPCYYSANASKTYIDWNSTLNVNPPNTNLNNTLYLRFPIGWNFTSINPVYTTSNYTIGANKILEIYNASSGNIIEYFRSKNLINEVTFEKFLGGKLYQNTGYTEFIDETVRINASFSYPVSGNLGNLSVFDFNGILNYTDQKIPINNILNFTNWNIDTTTKSNGSYIVRVYWNNGTAIGINTTYFHIIYPTTSSLISPSTTQIYYKQPINVTIYYKNDFSDNIYGETGIKNANVTAVFNRTDVYNLTETLGAGYYNTLINTSSYKNGTYALNITIEKFGYLNKSYNLEIEIIYNTSLSINTTSLTIYYSQEFDLELNYNRTDSYATIGLNSSTIQILINGTDASSYILINNTKQNIGNYTLHFNTTNCSNLLIPNFNIVTIRFSKQGYKNREIKVNVTILQAITTLNNHSITKRQGGIEVFNITVYYNNTILNKGISGANYSIFKDDKQITEVYSHNDVNNDTFCIYDFKNGTYNIELNITIGKNYTMQILIISNKTGYINGNKTVFQDVWVWATIVPMFTFSSTVTYGLNQTITIQYNQTGNGGVLNAKIFSTWNNIGYYDEFITDLANGRYSITFDTNLTMAGNRTITVYSRKNGYEWNSTTITFRIVGYITSIERLNVSTLAVYVNDSIYNVRIRYYNVSDNFNISNANVLFEFRNSTSHLFDNQTTSNYIIYENQTNGEYKFQINTSSLHADNYNLSITIELHNISIAFEYSTIFFGVNVNRLPSSLNNTLQTGNWWINSNTSLKWYELENITINIIFKADFYDSGSPVEGNVSWGRIYYEIIKVGETTPRLQGEFINLGDGIYQATVNLSMAIQSTTSENYRINVTGVALDIQNSSLSINLEVMAKKDLTILFLPLPEEIVEGTPLLIKAFVFDSNGRPAHGETVIIVIHIFEKSGLYHQYKIPINTVGGIALLYFQVPVNVQNILIEAKTERSLMSWASNSFYQPITTLPQIWTAVQFFRTTWPIFVAIAVAITSIYYYQRKYKPKKIKQKEVRDTISYKFKSAANLIHILVYDQKSSELLYIYSTPGIKITSYLMNSILESISMYDNMKVTRQEIYLRDDARLILHDGEFVRVAMITKELPSVEMQKQLEHFMNEFELKFGKKIPEWRQDISRLARMMDMGFANELIEKCFEKSLIFPHHPVAPTKEVELTSLETKLLDIAMKIRGKAGPFLLQRLIARGQTELAPQVTLLQILEGVYNLRKKGVLVPMSEKDAQRIRDSIFKKANSEKGT